MGKENHNTGFNPNHFKSLAELESKNFWFRARNRLIVWTINRYCPELKSFFEIGCGTGFVISAISKNFPDAKVLGSEYFEEGLIYARQRLPKSSFTQMDARSIPYCSKFDSIGAFDVLEHIEEDELVLKQIFKALQLGGFLFITVPQHKWLWSSVDDYACHVRRYNIKILQEKVRQAGFEVVSSTSFVTLLLPAMYFSRLLKKNKHNVNYDSMAELRINPILNKIFEWILDFEILLIRMGLSLPVGGSRLLVARKQKSEG